MRNVDQGSATTVHCAVAPDAALAGGNGQYFDKCAVGQATTLARSDEHAQKLHQLSIEFLQSKGFAVDA